MKLRDLTIPAVAVVAAPLCLACGAVAPPDGGGKNYDDAKAALPEFHGGIGANAVHEESSEIGARVAARLIERGANIILPKVGHNTQGIAALADDLGRAGYQVHLVNIDVAPENAFRRMIGRFLSTGRLINPDYFASIGDKPRQTFEALKGDKRIASYANVESNGPPGSQTVSDGAGLAADVSRGGRGGEVSGDPAPAPSAPTAPAGAREPAPAVTATQGDVSGQLQAPMAGWGEIKPATVDMRAEFLRTTEAATRAADRITALAADAKERLPQYTPGAARQHADGEPAGVFMFKPTALNVDADRFQFKSGGDKYGVTGALRSVTKWDPAKAQSIIVWEQRDGTLFVADGHQRAGLARRLTEQGHAKDIELPGVLYREADGISASDARAIAAMTNIANGSGSALDGAKVLRSRPDLMDGSLPLSIGKGKQAAMLARLDDEAFRMVVNKVAPEHYAALVGELIPHDGPRQIAALKALAQAEPKNTEEAGAVIARVKAAEFARAEEGRQVSMFEDFSPDTTAIQEMRIVGRAIADLKKDRNLFKRVVSNAGRIEETGSHIERDVAHGIVTDADVFARTLQSDAYAKGPVRDALVEAARDLKHGDIGIGEATDRVLAALRRQAEGHGDARSGAGARAEPPVEAGPEARPGAADDARARELAQKQEGIEPPEGDERTFFQDQRPDLLTEPGAEGLPQTLIPGVEPVKPKSDLDILRERIAAPLRGGDAPMPESGLFGERAQGELFQRAAGKIRLAPGKRSLITLAEKSDASTFMHESGHQFLEDLMADAMHEKAPGQMKDDADTVLRWLGAKSAEDIKTKHHEKFARGFEQYLREGVAPSAGLAHVFQQFKTWLTAVYQTLRGLGRPISDDIRGVFDRMLAENPQRTVLAAEPERPMAPHETHEHEAARIPPEDADAGADRIKFEADRSQVAPPQEIAHEIAAAVQRDEAAARPAGEPAGEVGARPAAAAAMAPGGAGPEPVAGRGALGAGVEPELRGGGAPAREGAGVRSADAGRSAGDLLGDTPFAPRPADWIGPHESPFVDRAGNIRVENLTTREDVAQAIRDSAAANNDFIADRRGVVTDGQVMDLAADLGMRYTDLLQRKVGQAFNAEQVMAARKLLVQSATEVAAAMKKAAAGTEQDIIAYAQARDRHQLIQAQIAGITAEAGRALRAFRDISMTGDAAAADQIVRQATGRTLFQLQREAQLGMALETPQQVSAWMRATGEHSFGKMMVEYWINSLLSGPATHTTNIIGNNILSLWKAGPETAAAAMIGALRRNMGREGETVRLGEVAEHFKAKWRSRPAALQAAIESLRTSQNALMPGEKISHGHTLDHDFEFAEKFTIDINARYSDAAASAFGITRGLKDSFIAIGGLLKGEGVAGAPALGLEYSPRGAIPNVTVKGVTVLPVGDLARAPSRFLSAADSYFKALNYSMDISAQAYRAAATEGLTGEAFNARVAYLRSNPTPEMMERAIPETLSLILTGPGGEFTKRLTALMNYETPGGWRPLKFINPFVRVASNIVSEAFMKRSPVGVFSAEIRADLSGANGTIAQDKAMARMLVGTATAITAGVLAAEGYISGSGPSDRNEAAAWRMAGNQAHSVRIGDIWYDIHKLGPIGMLISTAADLYEVTHIAREDELTEAAAHLQHAFVQNVLDQSFLKGPADLIKAVEDPKRYGASYINGFLSSFLPYSVGQAQVARAMDPYSRRAVTLVDSIKAKIPGLSESVLPRRDIWGEPIEQREAFGMVGVSSVYKTKVSKDPVNLALVELGVSPAAVQKKIRNVELTVRPSRRRRRSRSTAIAAAPARDRSCARSQAVAAGSRADRPAWTNVDEPATVVVCDLASRARLPQRLLLRHQRQDRRAEPLGGGLERLRARPLRSQIAAIDRRPEQADAGAFAAHAVRDARAGDISDPVVEAVHEHGKHHDVGPQRDFAGAGFGRQQRIGIGPLVAPALGMKAHGHARLLLQQVHDPLDRDPVERGAPLVAEDRRVHGAAGDEKVDRDAHGIVVEERRPHGKTELVPPDRAMRQHDVHGGEEIEIAAVIGDDHDAAVADRRHGRRRPGDERVPLDQEPGPAVADMARKRPLEAPPGRRLVGAFGRPYRPAFECREGQAGIAVFEHGASGKRRSVRLVSAAGPPLRERLTLEHGMADLVADGQPHLRRRARVQLDDAGRRAAGGDRALGERLGVAGDRDHLSVLADEDHVERDVGVLHPHVDDVVPAEVEQHAPVVGHVAPVHQALAVFGRRAHRLDRELVHARARHEGDLFEFRRCGRRLHDGNENGDERQHEGTEHGPTIGNIAWQRKPRIGSRAPPPRNQ
jgi:hypothetical protein